MKMKMIKLFENIRKFAWREYKLIVLFFKKFTKKDEIKLFIMTFIYFSLGFISIAVILVVAIYLYISDQPRWVWACILEVTVVFIMLYLHYFSDWDSDNFFSALNDLDVQTTFIWSWVFWVIYLHLELRITSLLYIFFLNNLDLDVWKAASAI